MVPPAGALYGGFLLKAIVVCHFVFTIWASCDPGMAFLPKAYTYMNLVIQFYGALSIVKHKSADVVWMFLLLLSISIVVDIVLLSVYNPPLYVFFESSTTGVTAVYLGMYRFALGMAILTVIMKPLSCFVLYRIYVDRGGNLADIVTQLRFKDQRYDQGYEDLERQPLGQNVETATAHTRVTVTAPGVPS